MGRGKACKSCNTRWVQCQVNGYPVASKPKASTPKTTEDGTELGNGLPKKKKKCKVVSKETIKESKAESEAEAKDGAAKRRLQTEWMWALLVISTKMCLLHKAQERIAKECANIARYASFIAGDLDLVVDGKQYICTHSHGPVDAETELPVVELEEEPKDGAEELKDMAEEADVDMTLKE